jgi:GNAT superfamily N-acetyltransferase
MIRRDGTGAGYAPGRIVIRPATKRDGAGLAALMAQMEGHYEGPDAIDESVVLERLRAHWPEGDGALLLVAVIQNDPPADIVGFATMFRLFPGRAIEPVWWLKELYVAKDTRGQGVGASILRACARHVRSTGGTRLDWTTAMANTEARRLYERLGGVALEAVVYRAEGDDLQALAAQAPAMEHQSIADADGDIDAMTPEQLRTALRRARTAIRAHRDATGHDLCWHHPDLWAQLPEDITPNIAVPPWPQFLRGCVAYRASLDRELPNAPAHGQEYHDDR